MGVDVPVRLTHAAEPAGEITPQRLATRGHMNRFDELPVGEEHRFLPHVLEAVGVIQVACVRRQIGRMRDVEHLALGMLELLQRQRRLAAAGATNHHERRRQPVDGFLGIVEGDRLVEHMHLAVLGVQVAQRLGFAPGLHGITVGYLRVVDGRAAQKPRLVIFMVGDDFQHQGADLVAVADEREQQAVGVVQARAVELAVGDAGQLLHLRSAEVVRQDGLHHLAVRPAHARGVETDVFENSHGLGSSWKRQPDAPAHSARPFGNTCRMHASLPFCTPLLRTDQPSTAAARIIPAHLHPGRHHRSPPQRRRKLRRPPKDQVLPGPHCLQDAKGSVPAKARRRFAPFTRPTCAPSGSVCTLTPWQRIRCARRARLDPPSRETSSPHARHRSLGAARDSCKLPGATCQYRARPSRP